MSRKVKVNMEGVESFTRCPEGEWLAQLKKAEMGEVQGSGADPGPGQDGGQGVYHRCHP